MYSIFSNFSEHRHSIHTPVDHVLQQTSSSEGPSIKYVTLFLANFDPILLSHFVTHPGTPQKYVTHLRPPNFSKPSTKIPGNNPLYKFSLNCSRGFLFQGVFCLVSFVRGGFYPYPFYQNISVTTES